MVGNASGVLVPLCVRARSHVDSSSVWLEHVPDKEVAYAIPVPAHQIGDDDRRGRARSSLPDSRRRHTRTTRTATADLTVGITARITAVSAPVVLTNGLNNPRQLSLVDGKVLLIAEAGRAVPTCQGTGEDEMCVGATGSVSGVLFPQAGHQPRAQAARDGSRLGRRS